MYEVGSPGRVLLLDESDVANRLARIDTLSDGNFRWSETAGIKQLIRSADLQNMCEFSIIRKAFSATPELRAAE